MTRVDRIKSAFTAIACCGIIPATIALNYTYQIYPDEKQVELLNEWLETFHNVYNYALRELRDWIASSDAGLGKFRTILSYVGKQRGVYVAQVDHKGTSQISPNWGIEVRKELSDGNLGIGLLRVMQVWESLGLFCLMLGNNGEYMLLK
ncbi:helix-turn-helix domain-containing protein [Dapis sp. BLCC M229]|uniref:helix-turn-helix domain-containing protein n=1 Tax=Dapis sp. BLCC M229 TaxID=3400188 RepID=UPI003CEB6916